MNPSMNLVTQGGALPAVLLEKIIAASGTSTVRATRGLPPICHLPELCAQ